jgi:MEMO1 family protein
METCKTRKADFAGSWYPAAAEQCEREIQGFLENADTADIDSGPLIGGIVPHAGWYFSGNIACNVIHRLQTQTTTDAVVIFGMHMHPHSRPVTMTAGAWDTPLGPLPIHSELAEHLAREFDAKVETADRYSQDNTIELQLPFVRHCFGAVPIVPMGVPPSATAIEIGRAAAEAGRRMGLRLKIIGSTDLTHYGRNYGFNPKGEGDQALEWMRSDNDRRFIDAILAMDPEGVLQEARSSHNACCAGAVAAALTAAKALGSSSPRTLAYATSHDKHPGDSFVGYVGVVF